MANKENQLGSMELPSVNFGGGISLLDYAKEPNWEMQREKKRAQRERKFLTEVPAIPPGLGKRSAFIDMIEYEKNEEKQRKQASLGQINAVDQSEWEKTKIAVDSGAVDHVMPKELGKEVQIEETEASRK